MIKCTRLENGLRVMTDEMQNIHSINIGIWIKVGARHELFHEHGLAHMLEHMAFKGTETRSARDIAEQIENVGGMMNAYTGREQTAYFMRAMHEHAELCTEILGDILQNSTFDEEEIEREKGVIIQEIGECEDNPDDLLFDSLGESCYPQQSLGRNILGTRETVMNMSREALFDYIKRHYTPENMIFAASGKITHEKMLDLAHKYLQFPSRPAGTVTVPSRWGGGVNLLQKDLEQLHMALALPGLSYSDNDFYISEVYSMLYGGGMSSRLFQEIREKKGLVYSISSFTSNLEDGGSFGIYAGTDPEQAYEVLDSSITEMEKLANHTHQQEVDRAKAQLRSGLVMGLESPVGRSEALVKQHFIFGRQITTEEMMNAIDDVTCDDIRSFSARLLRSGKAAYCVLGNIEHIDTESQERLARFLPN
ncbi:MAG: pitrilysin family protein [Pseudomonadota bacterium]